MHIVNKHSLLIENFILINIKFHSKIRKLKKKTINLNSFDPKPNLDIIWDNSNNIKNVLQTNAPNSTITVQETQILLILFS